MQQLFQICALALLNWLTALFVHLSVADGVGYICPVGTMRGGMQEMQVESADRASTFPSELWMLPGTAIFNPGG